jgi:hypothetical protein
MAVGLPRPPAAGPRSKALPSRHRGEQVGLVDGDGLQHLGREGPVLGDALAGLCRAPNYAEWERFPQDSRRAHVIGSA